MRYSDLQIKYCHLCNNKLSKNNYTSCIRCKYGGLKLFYTDDYSLWFGIKIENKYFMLEYSLDNSHLYFYKIDGKLKYIYNSIFEFDIDKLNFNTKNYLNSLAEKFLMLESFL
jgi:hypothetical protein